MVIKRVIPIMLGLYLLGNTVNAQEKPTYFEGGNPSRYSEYLFDTYGLERFHPKEVKDLFSIFDSNMDGEISGEELSDPRSNRIFKHQIRILENK